MLESVWRKGKLLSTLLVEIKSGTIIVENSMEFLEKLKIKLLYDPGIPLLGIYLEKILNQKDIDVHSSTT